MSFRMDQFHDMVRMNTPKMNPMMTNNCCHGNDVPVGLEIANAFLSIGGQVAMMALQAKAAEQNQNASTGNAAINTVMGEGQQALQNVMINSGKTVSYQQKIAEINARLENAGTVGARETAKTEFVSNYSSTNVDDIIKDIKYFSSTNKNLTAGLNRWNELNNTIAELTEKTKNRPTFKSSFFTVTAGGNFEQQVRSNESEYVTVSKDGEKTKLTAAFEHDLKQAQEADKKYEEYEKAQQDLKTAQNDLADLKKDLNDLYKIEDAEILEGENTLVTSSIDIDMINSPEDLSKLIEDNNKKIAELEAKEIKGTNGDITTVAGYTSKLNGLDAELKTANDDAAEVEKLNTQKTGLENKLKESEENLKTLKNSYDKLNTMLKALEACDVNYDNIKTTELDEAKGDLKKLRENNSFFTKMFSKEYKGQKTTVKEGISDKKEGVSVQKENAKATAEANAKAFNKDYGTPPTQALKNQIIAQMNLIENTIKQAGLEELAKKNGFEFST